MHLETEQELFDHVCSNLLRQGRTSVHEGYCLYRSPDGAKCAAGWCIPDEEYDESMEGKSANMLRGNHFASGVIPSWIVRWDDTIARLQRVHDRYLPDEWPRLMKNIARIRCLNPRVIDEFEKSQGYE